HRRTSCRSTFRSFVCVRIDLDQAAGAPALRTSATGAGRAGARSSMLRFPKAAIPEASIDLTVSTSRDAIPCVSGGGHVARRMFELGMIRQVRDFDAIGIQTFVVDQPLRQCQRLGGTNRLDLDLALQALEAVAVGIAEIFVE